MKEFRYINNYTGELYISIYHALKTVIMDFFRVPACRTLKLFSISKYDK